MKLIYLFLLLLLISCSESFTIIKSIECKEVDFIWYRDYCGSNGCDFVVIKNNTRQRIIYQYYGNGLKDIKLKYDTLFVYYSERIEKKEFFNYYEGNIYGYNVNFVSVPATTCNYLEKNNNSTHCSGNVPE